MPETSLSPNRTEGGLGMDVQVAIVAAIVAVAAIIAVTVFAARFVKA